MSPSSRLHCSARTQPSIASAHHPGSPRQLLCLALQPHQQVMPLPPQPSKPPSCLSLLLCTGDPLSKPPARAGSTPPQRTAQLLASSDTRRPPQPIWVPPSAKSNPEPVRPPQLSLSSI
ncbi:hypothetical protein Taro_044105 [Colocasia esculenta]|uniref:Uncharacterized protein n=1 Tax=Colocasia esculenta TaxID=4460 RepID=A0A843X057_COLES|nr:hypothetical protein [Colocasia esculenta]